MYGILISRQGGSGQDVSAHIKSRLSPSNAHTRRSTAIEISSARLTLQTGSFTRVLELGLYSPVVIICTPQWSLYVPHSGHYTYRSGQYMYRTVVTICTVQWSLCVPPVVTVCTAQWSLYVPPVVTICTAQWSLYVPPVVTICTAQWALYVPPF